MSVSAGVGGTSVVGVVVGAGAGVNGASAATVLPFTGASQLMLLVTIGVALLVAGVLVLGLVRRESTRESP
jgi:LPXTG-motif cell wall-anchored protein